MYCWPLGANTVLETLVMVYDASEGLKGPSGSPNSIVVLNP